MIDNPSLLIIALSQCVKSTGTKWDGTLGGQVSVYVSVCMCGSQRGSIAKRHTNPHTHTISQRGRLSLLDVSLCSHTGEKILSNQELKSKSFLRDCNARG